MNSRSSHWSEGIAALPTWPAPLRHAFIVAVLTLLLLAGTLLVYFTGGTRYAYAYLMLVPVLLAAATYHLPGALAAALAAGVLVGPWMPLDVDQGLAQSQANWLVRLSLYMGIGALAGALFGHLARMAQSRENSLRRATCGLLNDAALATDLKQVLEQSRDQAQVALILIQAADYGEILSGIGADSGDELLAAIGGNLRRALHDRYRIYRFGGSELLVLLEYEEDQELREVVDMVIAAGEEPVRIHDVPVRAQLVAGVSRAGKGDREPQELIRRVRVAAFEATEQQQAYCFYASEYERDTAATIRLVAQVRRALAAGEFEVHYQPKIRLADGVVHGCEGLVRWRDQEQHLIPPGLFMPKVERTTLIAPVTRFVALQAFRFAQSHSVTPVSFNFAVSNLFDQRLLQWVIQLVKEQQLDPESLEIEITEGALIRDPEAAKQTIRRLRDAGICVLLDDFGTGYSSFGHLRHLPISGIKIDRAFVQDLETDRRAFKLMACMIDMAHALDLKVTAEGVETAGQEALLRELGCDLAQGFYYAHAMPEDQYHSWLTRHQQAHHRHEHEHRRH